ncbi:lactonase family protein [Alteromonas sp. a30]|uniref:lactonase family protein n=1 Tax=Alteromonas sp. a30 TaxID=2730917 RepID=UPI002281E0C0|nr:beta-propeller fold lactonase family protein [Alteromonas sp. a30]MCY7297367.1 beta-propeller fold lactonase family protein [Alteromonas sp. a30]
MQKLLKPFLLYTVALGGLSSASASANTNDELSAELSTLPQAVYLMTNESPVNSMIVYHTRTDGSLALSQRLKTGGAGVGNNDDNLFDEVPLIDPMGSQNSVILSEDKNSLYAVNPGSGDISVFHVNEKGGLQLIQVVDSLGEFPVSLTTDGELVYVLNAGGSGSIAGYTIGEKGDLTYLPNSARKLGLNNPVFPNAAEVPLTPGQVSFDNDERRLIITNGGGQELLTYSVLNNGTPSYYATSSPTAGIIPFDFIISDNGALVVAEVAPDLTGFISSYEISDLNLRNVTSALPTNGVASCWIVSNGDRFAYMINTGSSTISTYEMARNGQLSLVKEVSADLNGSFPIDATMTPDGRSMFVINSQGGSISHFDVDPTNGTLTLRGKSAPLNLTDEKGNQVVPQGIAVR